MALLGYVEDRVIMPLNIGHVELIFWVSQSFVM